VPKTIGGCSASVGTPSKCRRPAHQFGSGRLLDQRWIFAGTAPENPHWNALRRNLAGPDRFDETVLFIRRHGHTRRFRGRPRTCLDFDGMRYWTMGAPVENPIPINRADKSCDNTAAPRS
jgi:hypothetical protein